jgi:hypothetical protein
LAAIHCSRRWRKAGFSSNEEVTVKVPTDEQLDDLYHMDWWAIGLPEEKLNTKKAKNSIKPTNPSSQPTVSAKSIN